MKVTRGPTIAYISEDDCTFFSVSLLLSKGFPGGTVIKNLPADAGYGRCKRCILDASPKFDPWVRKIP